MLAVITEKVEIVYAMADSDNIDNAIHDLTQLIDRLMPYIKHLFFLEENLIRDLDFDIVALEEFINTPLMQLQTGDIIGIQAWVHEDAYIPLTKIVTVKNKQRKEVIKQMARDKADHEGSSYDGQRQKGKRGLGRGGGKRTRRKKCIKGGKKKKSKKKLFNKKKENCKKSTTEINLFSYFISIFMFFTGGACFTFSTILVDEAAVNGMTGGGKEPAYFVVIVMVVVVK